MWGSEEAFKIYGLEKTSDNSLPLALVQKFVLPEYRQKMDQILEELIKNNKEYNIEFKIRRGNNGEERFIHSKAELIYDQNKNPIKVDGVLQDITESKLAGEALKFSEEKYRSLIENAIDVICTHDLKGQITSINQAIEKYGFKKDQIIGRNIFELIPNEFWPAITSQLQDSAQGKSIESEAEVITPLGRIKTEYKSNPIRQAEKIIGVQTIIRDISERKKTEQLLKINEERLRAIISNAPFGIATVDSNLYFLTANDSFCKILGYSEDELRKLTFKEITHNEDLQESFSKMANLFSGKLPFFTLEKRYIRKDGVIIDGKVTINAIRDKDYKPTLFVAELEDITESKRAKIELEQKYEILERITESLESGLAIINKDYDVIWANAVIRNLGVSPNKKCYQTFNTLDQVCPDCGVKKIFEKNVLFDVHEYKTADSKGETVWIELRVTPLKDKNGKVIAGLELAIPITERKKVEEQIVEDQTKLEIVNEKLQVVGSLTRHDVANKLAVAKSNAYLLKKKIENQPELIKYIDAIDLAINQSSKIFEFSHFYEKIGAEEPTQIDVAESLDQAVALVPNLRIEVVNKVVGLKVLADSMLRQLFYNFIDNSLRHGKTITKIEVSYTENAAETKLIYEDNGVGIPEDNKEKIFSRGFTTTSGSGLGLKLVKRMAEAYGWSIKEKGVYGKGAKFEITIPNRQKPHSLTA